MYYLYSKSYLKDTDRTINKQWKPHNKVAEVYSKKALYGVQSKTPIQGTDRAGPRDLTQVLQQILGQGLEPMSHVLYTTHINTALQF